MEDNSLLINTGRIKYPDAYDLQMKCLQKVIDGRVGNVLILAEHEPVITLGRGFKNENLLLSRRDLEDRGLTVFDIERGGDATYHGPGQIVGYPIFNLDARGRDLRLFITEIEEVIITVLGGFKIKACRKKGQIGVWTEGKKIASIGIAVKKWVSYHGFCLNISPAMENFSYINPCGLHYNVMTSMEKILNTGVSFEDVRQSFVSCFESVFKISLTLPEES